jgi:hypothetical protein
MIVVLFVGTLVDKVVDAETVVIVVEIFDISVV